MSDASSAHELTDDAKSWLGWLETTGHFKDVVQIHKEFEAKNPAPVAAKPGAPPDYGMGGPPGDTTTGPIDADFSSAAPKPGEGVSEWGNPNDKAPPREYAGDPKKSTVGDLVHKATGLGSRAKNLNQKPVSLDRLRRAVELKAGFCATEYSNAIGDVITAYTQMKADGDKAADLKGELLISFMVIAVGPIVGRAATLCADQAIKKLFGEGIPELIQSHAKAGIEKIIESTGKYSAIYQGTDPIAATTSLLQNWRNKFVKTQESLALAAKDCDFSELMGQMAFYMTHDASTFVTYIRQQADDFYNDVALPFYNNQNAMRPFSGKDPEKYFAIDWDGVTWYALVGVKDLGGMKGLHHRDYTWLRWIARESEAAIKSSAEPLERSKLGKVPAPPNQKL